MPPLAAQNILWDAQFFFCTEAQKKNCASQKKLSAAEPPFIHAKIVKEPASLLFRAFIIYITIETKIRYF
jgi:hypothetical protein